ncbi:amidophosphoribosyltransferase [Mariniblastus sp.]|jgi:amidophosphoribosyltransferase|nr:amidophosphoribosyltransferase [Mariniblastus sp.]MDB4756851.1 amidophosphoribosyltransferase [Mariniblastus sp.]
MSEIFHECGVAAIYHLPEADVSPLSPTENASTVSRLVPRMLLDIQNRGQLAAGMTSFRPDVKELLKTHKEIGTVAEVFRMSHPGKSESLMKGLEGTAAIGHVRYATCGKDERSYAQPFEREHLQRHKWFSFGFNGQLANYTQLREELLNSGGDYHLSRDTDTEIIMHEIGRAISADETSSLLDVVRKLASRFDGAYSIAIMNAVGDMIVARDPMGIKPMCYAFDGSLFAAASENVALLNLGFKRSSIYDLPPGHAVSIVGGKVDIDANGEIVVQKFADSPRRAHCFFEWIYFANVASTLDKRSVYVSRTQLGAELAKIEMQNPEFEIDEDTIVVPVPDTSKAAADSMAFELGVPSREGLIRNRYSGRTFIATGRDRVRIAETKYTPLREVMKDKRVILVEDSIVRSTTMRVLLHRIYEEGLAKEIHVRVACPPIMSPCFYGIDFSTIGELFAPKYIDTNGRLSDEAQVAMAKELGCDSLRYLPIESIARAINLPSDDLCQGCITSTYPTECGQQLYQIAVEAAQSEASNGGRIFESKTAAAEIIR